jgi:Domain of unknown function (DUF4267)
MPQRRQSKRPLSHSAPLLLAATVFGTIFLGFGINALLRPSHALTFFEVHLTPEDLSSLITGAVIVYGIRDIFMGLAILFPAYFRARKVLGWILMAAAAVAVGDGVVCKVYVGSGEWGHWGYAPAVAGVGVVLAGVLD